MIALDDRGKLTRYAVGPGGAILWYGTPNPDSAAELREFLDYDASRRLVALVHSPTDDGRCSMPQATSEPRQTPLVH